jgi:putative aldouronate transport system permease protein
MKAKRSKVNKEPMILFLMVLPCIIFIFIFSYLPLRGWLYAFYNWKPGYNLFDCKFVGLENFAKMFSNPVLRQKMLEVLRNTLAIAGIGILFSSTGPIFAIFLNEMRSNKYRRILQTFTTLPHFVSWVIMYSVVFFMLSMNGGFINNLLVNTGLIENRINFLASSDYVWLKMQLYATWKEMGWGAIIYLAAIAGIDSELYTAATVDGANNMQKIWYITIPGIIPTYFVMLIIACGNFLNVGMEQFLVFQNPMNKEYTDVLDLYVYKTGIGSGSISYATAVGVLKSVVSIIMFAFVNRLSKIVRGYSIF